MPAAGGRRDVSVKMDTPRALLPSDGGQRQATGESGYKECESIETGRRKMKRRI